MKKLRVLVGVALLVAMQIVLTRVFRIETPIVRVSFSFIPIAVSGMLFGPWITGISQIAADLIGITMFPSPGGFFPGFTLSAFCVGVIYGWFLKDDISVKNIVISTLLITVFVNLGLNTLWVSIMTKTSFFVLLPTRLVSNAVLTAVKIVVLPLLLPRLKPILEQRYEM